MPPDGKSSLARFADAIVHGRGFALGPARVSGDGSTVTVPILRAEAPSRRYVLASESSEAVSAEDTGRIDHLRVHNESERLIFLPPGTIFAGPETTSRGTTAGILIAPSASRDVDVRCLDPSRPVVKGGVLTVTERLARLDVTQSLLSRDQGLVWATVPRSPPEDESDGPAVGPEMPRECGRILLDARGVVAVEAYDHPRSWSAAGSRPQGPFAANPLGLNPAKAVSVAEEFLAHLASTLRHAADSSAWVAVDASSACAQLEGEVIHLLAFGRNLTEPSPADLTDDRAIDRSTEVTVTATDASSNAWSDADVAVATRSSAGAMDEAQLAPYAVQPHRRKILTTGWDGSTLASLERLSRKEFGGDRSAAIRALVRRGLWDGGYLGPRSPPPMSHSAPLDVDGDASALSPTSVALEGKIREYERIAETETYADWLRKRARLEIERLQGGTGPTLPDEGAPPLSSSPPIETGEQVPVPEEIEPEPSFLPPPPPVDVRPLLRRAFAASAAGRYPDALTLFDDVLTGEPDNRTALLGRAVALRRSGKAQEALDALDAVLRVDPANAAALLNRGRLLQERGDLTAALEAFDLLSTVAPNDWDVWLVRGDVLAKLGRRPEALQAYSEALRRNPDDESLQRRIQSLENAESSQAPPPAPRVPLPRDVHEGQSYLVPEGRPSLSLRVLRSLAARGVPAMAISTRAPDAVRRDVGVVGVRVLELTHAPGEGRYDPTALAVLSHTVSRFLQEGHGHGVIALDGLGALVQENGSREVLLFIERVHEAVLQSHAVFLVSVAPGELSDRETALLERSLRTLS